MTEKQKKMLSRIIIASFLVTVLAFIPSQGILRLLLYLVPYLIIGYDILKKAAKGIIRGRVLDESFLMAVATIGAIILGAVKSGDYLEAVAVMLFYQIGELFQSYAVGKSRKSISALMDIRPDYANIEKDGELIKVDPEEVKIGTVITVRQGEKIPIDGTVIEGVSSINTSALTGESLPCDIKAGDSVISGSVNLSGVLKIKTEKAFSDSTVSKILELVESASSRKSRSENFISKFARIYTPAVCISALLLAFLPPVLTLIFSHNDPMWGTWLYRSLSFLVASCPCALVVSIPLTFFAGIGGASKHGILIKGSNYLEMLSKTRCVVFDKTGTLTEGVFEVNAVHHNIIDEKKLIEYAALAESSSSHPIAHSIIAKYGKKPDISRVCDITEISGNGVMATVDKKRVACGNKSLMSSLGIEYKDCRHQGTVIHVAIDGRYEGHIVISDRIKATSKSAIAALKKCGVKKTVMLTGDRKEAAEKAAKEIGIKEYFSDLLPNEKVAKVEELINGNNGTLAFVGDGINDAPVISRADIGIAMGALGSDAAIEAADIVLTDDNVEKLALAISISKKCLNIVYENIVFSIAVKILALVLVALGLANMWLAIFADVGTAVIAILNATRALFIKK